MKYNSVLILALFVCVSLISSNVCYCDQEVLTDQEEAVKTAYEMYTKGEYDQAIEIYEALIAKGITNEHIEYNLGNALYRDGQLGRAILHYRRGLYIAPISPDLTYNIRMARKHAKDDLSALDKELPLRGLSFLLGIHNVLKPSQITVVSLSFYATFWLTLAAYALLKRKWLKTACISFFIISTLWVGLSWSAKPDRLHGFRVALWDRNLRPAVITGPEANIHSGNGEEFQVITTLHEGAEVMVSDQRDNWLEITLPGQRKGWVLAQDAEVI